MNDKNLPPTSEKTASPAMASRRAAIQRGLRKGGMVAAPVLMSTLGHSAMAAPGTATTPSGFHSINASRPELPSNGQLPGYWADIIDASISFASVLGSQFPGDSNNNTKMKAVLKAAAGSTQNPTLDERVAGYIGAAYYNALNHLTDKVLPVDAIGQYSSCSVKAMWAGYVAGNYSPRTGVTWDGNQIIEYLQSTMD